MRSHRGCRIGLMSPVQMDRRNWGATIAAVQEAVAWCRDNKEDAR